MNNEDKLANIKPLAVTNGSAENQTACCFTRGEVDDAFARAVAEVADIAGEDDAIDLIAELAVGQPSGDGPFAREDDWANLVSRAATICPTL